MWRANNSVADHQQQIRFTSKRRRELLHYVHPTDLQPLSPRPLKQLELQGFGEELQTGQKEPEEEPVQRNLQ